MAIYLAFIIFSRSINWADGRPGWGVANALNVQIIPLNANGIWLFFWKEWMRVNTFPNEFAPCNKRHLF